MKKFLAISFVLIFALFTCCSSTSTDASEMGVLLYEINPYGDDEGVSLHNYSSSVIDLKGYSVSDNPSISSGEGSFTFGESFKLGPGETVTFVKNKDLPSSHFIGRYTTYSYGTAGLFAEKRNMDLANGGDDIYLFNTSGTIIDAFCYGSKTITDDSIWSGKSFTIKTDSFAVRKNVDTNSNLDWYNNRVGWTNILFDPDVQMIVNVTPFTFPESGGVPIFQALEGAKESIYLSMYQLSSKEVCALLDKLAKQGVSITILLEADTNPVITVDHCLPEIRTLVDDGCDVKFIDLNGRYQYVHSKYCIIDEKMVIITSENWTQKNLNRKVVSETNDGVGNRGWGAIVDSTEYAAYMKKIFDNDIDPEYGDVRDFLEVKTVTGTTLTYTLKDTYYPLSTYSCTITPVLSPDNSLDATNYYIDNATYRVYSEQQSLTSTYSDIRNESPIKHMAVKAEAGVDSRFILNSNYPKKSDVAEAEQSVKTINESTYIKAATMNSVYVHNKGLICDDTVFVSSVNWTATSLYNNRESCIAIHSKDVADYYATYFLQDFGRNYTYSGLIVSFKDLKETYENSGELVVEVLVDQSGSYTYKWVFDGQELQTTQSKALLNVTDGKHTLKVTASNESGNEGYAYKEFVVGKTSSNTDPDSGSTVDVNGIIDKIKPYIIPIIIIILGLLLALAKAASGGKKKSKKKGGKKR